MASTFEALLLAQVNFLLNPPRLKASILAATALSTGSNIAYSTITEDSYGGWNATSHFWVVPVAGLYKASLQFKWNGTPPGSPPAANILKNGSNALVSANASSTATFAGLSSSGFVRANAGDTIAVQLANAGFTTQVDTADNNFLTLKLDSL